jgi:hypothetical protein
VSRVRNLDAVWAARPTVKSAGSPPPIRTPAGTTIWSVIWRTRSRPSGEVMRKVCCGASCECTCRPVSDAIRAAIRAAKQGIRTDVFNVAASSVCRRRLRHLGLFLSRTNYWNRAARCRWSGRAGVPPDEGTLQRGQSELGLLRLRLSRGSHSPRRVVFPSRGSAGCSPGNSPSHLHRCPYRNWPRYPVRSRAGNRLCGGRGPCQE